MENYTKGKDDVIVSQPHTQTPLCTSIDHLVFNLVTSFVDIFIEKSTSTAASSSHYYCLFF